MDWVYIIVIEVKLEPHTIRYAATIAIDRRMMGLNKPGKFGIQQEKKGLDSDWHGAIGEAAVAKHYRVWWDGGVMGVFTQKDVGRHQVRATPYETGHLFIHNEDADHDIFILALLHKLPIVVLAGWQRAGLCKNPDWWRDNGEGRTAFWVKQNILWSMKSFVF